MCVILVLPAPLDHSLRNWSLYSLHHGEMLLIVMCLPVRADVKKIKFIPLSIHNTSTSTDLKQCEAFVVFKQDAANTPDITGVTPAQLCGRGRQTETFTTNYNSTGSPSSLPGLSQHLLPRMTSGAR